VSADKLIREVELLVERLEEFVDKALVAHREYCEKVKTREYTVEKCASGLAWALTPIVTGYVARNIQSRIAMLTAKHGVVLPELYKRVEEALGKLRRAARAR
jgi:hypothetical protein